VGLAAVMDLVLERGTGTESSSRASPRLAHSAIRRASTARCATASAAQVANGCSGSKKRSACRLGGSPRALRSSMST
jgi:hypothetical protein